MKFRSILILFAAVILAACLIPVLKNAGTVMPASGISTQTDAQTEIVRDGTLSAKISAVVNGQTVNTTVVNGVPTLFLPSSADLSALELKAETSADAVLYCGRNIITEKADISALTPDENGVYTATLRLEKYESPSKTLYNEMTVRVMKSENIGAMFITVKDKNYGRAWIDSDPYRTRDAGKVTTVGMYLETASGETVYDNKLTSWKGRGNSTWGAAVKKPYQIKLDKKTDLLSSGNSDNKAKTWILLANAFDRTLWKNALAFDLARYLGLDETPEYTFVDLYTDGEYRGNYVLCEKVQINTGRLEIADLEALTVTEDETAVAEGVNKYGCTYHYNPTSSVPEGTDISGGYLCELDPAYYRNENSWFQVRLGGTYYSFVVKSPEFATKAQMEYVSEFFFEALHAMRDGKCSYTGQGIDELVDVNSVGAIYMLNEYTFNVDYVASSSFFYLPEEGNAKYRHVVYAGPAWDFDTSMGNRTELSWMQDANKADYWINRNIFASAEIKAAIGENAVKLDALRDIIFSDKPVCDEKTGVKSISWYTRLLTPGSKMNYSIWAFERTANTFCLPTYEENVKYTTDFLYTRHTQVLPKFTALAPSVLPGDADGDGKVTVSDARLILRAAIGLEKEDAGFNDTSSLKFKACDTDDDKRITVADARTVLRRAIGLE